MPQTSAAIDARIEAAYREDRAYLPAHHQPRPRTLVRIAPGIVQVRLPGSAVFLLLDQRVTVVDAGLPGSAGRVLAALRACGRSPDDVERVIISHHHPDHAGGLAALLKVIPARAAVHALDAAAVSGGAPWPAPIWQPRLAQICAPALRWLPRAGVDDLLHDGDELSVLGGLRVVHTPGHTHGHIALHLPNAGVLLAGDAIQRRPGRLTPPLRVVTADWSAALASVRRLATLEFEILALSHFPPVRRNATEELRRLARTLPDGIEAPIV